MTLDRTARAIFLWEFLGAFALSMRYFFKPKATINYPHEKNPLSPRFAASMRCAAIRMAKSAALPANYARRSALPRPSPSRPDRAATMARVARPATISIW